MAAIIDDEVKNIFDKASALCEDILSEHQSVLTAVAEYLLIHETMDGADFDYFCDHGELPPKAEPAVQEQKEAFVKPEGIYNEAVEIPVDENNNDGSIEVTGDVSAQKEQNDPHDVN